MAKEVRAERIYGGRAQSDIDLQEALELLRVIDAEFQSDPMSVQCFDLRIVARVRALVARVGE